MVTLVVQPRPTEHHPVVYQAADRARAPPPDPHLAVLYHSPARYLCVDKPADVRIDGDFAHTVEKLALAHLAQTSVNGEELGQTSVNGVTGGLGQTPVTGEELGQTAVTGEELGQTAVTGEGLGQRPGDRNPVKIRFIQRLDYATSGVMLLGLAKIPTAIACAQFEARSVTKHYLAIVHGAITPDTATTIDAPIADGLPEGSFHMRIHESGRASRTNFDVLATGRMTGAPVSKVLLRPSSGRRHQLRVHLQHIGHPIVGDATYAPEADAAAFDGPVHRMMLHATKLIVALPDDDAVLHGRKSAVRNNLLRERTFRTEDPFTERDITGLVWDELEAQT